MSLSPDMKAGRLTYDPEYAMHMSAIGGKADIASGSSPLVFTALTVTLLIETVTVSNQHCGKQWKIQRPGCAPQWQ